MSNALEYTESKWVKGDVVSSARLNNIEKGVLNLTVEVNRLENTLGPSVSGGPADSMPSEGFSDTDSKLLTAQAIADARGKANGLAPLNASGIVPSQYLPSYVDDILEFENYSAFPSGNTDENPNDSHTPAGPETNKIYVAKDTGYTYRWSGTQYVEVSWTPTKIQNLINTTIDSLDVSDSPDGTKYVSGVSETNGKITVSRETFSPALTLTAGDNNNTPKIKATVAGNDSNIITLTTATTSAYGATKLNNNTVVSNALSADETLAVTALGVKNAIEYLDVSDTPDSTKYVSGVSETNGKISVSRATFSPSLGLTAGTTANAPKINVTVATNTSSDIELTKATEGISGIYGVTKLSNAINSNDTTIAATPKAVSDAVASANTYTDNSINALDGGAIGTPSAGKTISAVSQTNGQVSVSFQDINILSSQISDKGTANCVATLDANGHVPSSQLPSYVDDVLEYANASLFPATGENGKIYVDLSANVSYRWGGSTYVKIASDLGLGETEATAYRGDHGKAAYDHATAKGSAFSSGLYKITTNAEGHVTAASAVEKSDITELGIPAQDTTYESLAPMENGTTASLVTTGEKAQWNSINIWDDVTSQCTFATGVTGKVMLNKAMKMGFFSCVSPSATAADATLLTFPPLLVGNSNIGQYFNSKLDGNMLISAAIPEGSKSVKQIHSSNNASTQQFNASGMFMYREPVSHTLTIRHVGTSLPDHIETLEEYDNYTYTVPSVEHFTVSPASLSITMGTEDLVRVLTYTQITHTLTINYEYEDHTTAATTYSNVINEGESYSVNSPVIDGFTANISIVSGTLNTDTTITVTYTENE